MFFIKNKLIIGFSIIIIIIISTILYFIFKKPSSCNKNCNNGLCKDGKCICDKGYTGSDCSVKCFNNNGLCLDDGSCICNHMFVGSNCDQCNGPFYITDGKDSCKVNFDSIFTKIPCYLTFTFNDPTKKYSLIKGTSPNTANTYGYEFSTFQTTYLFKGKSNPIEEPIQWRTTNIYNDFSDQSTLYYGENYITSLEVIYKLDTLIDSGTHDIIFNIYDITDNNNKIGKVLLSY